MASNLLKTFEGIDMDRKILIGLLNQQGFNIPTNGKFTDIISAIMNNTVQTIENYKWHRPAYWPDTKEILVNAPSFEGYFPYAVALMDDTLDMVKIPLHSNARMELIYTSDKSIYRFEDTPKFIEHTWDKTKDVCLDDTHHLRYVIIYSKLTNTTAQNYICTYTGSVSGCDSIVGIDNNSWACTILEFYIGLNKDSSNFPGTGSRYASYVYLPFNMPKKNNKLLSLITDVNLNSINLRLIGEPHNYKALINVDTALYITSTGYSYGFKTLNLQNYIYKGDNIEYEQHATSMSIKYMELVNTKTISSNRSFGSKYCFMNLGSVEECNGAIKCNYLNAPNLKTQHASIGACTNLVYLPELETVASDYMFNELPIIIIAPKLKHIENQLYSTGIEERFGLAIYMPSLSEINIATIFNSVGLTLLTLGSNFKSNITLNNTNLSSNNLVDILNKLADLTTEGITKTITLGDLKNLLTEDQIAIATNKGWVVA